MNKLTIIGSTAAMAVLLGVTAIEAKAAGGKMRLANDLIEEGYLLCKKDGVETVTVNANGTEITIDCSKVPGWKSSESESED